MEFVAFKGFEDIHDFCCHTPTFYGTARHGTVVFQQDFMCPVQVHMICQIYRKGQGVTCPGSSSILLKYNRTTPQSMQSKVNKYANKVKEAKYYYD